MFRTSLWLTLIEIYSTVNTVFFLISDHTFSPPDNARREIQIIRIFEFPLKIRATGTRWFSDSSHNNATTNNLSSSRLLPFFPWKLLLKPVWFTSWRLTPGVPWKSQCSLLPFPSSIFCLRIAYVLYRTGFWTRSIFTIGLLHVFWNLAWTFWYSCTSFEESSSYRCTVISLPCGSFGWTVQWFGTWAPKKRICKTCFCFQLWF